MRKIIISLIIIIFCTLLLFIIIKNNRNQIIITDNENNLLEYSFKCSKPYNPEKIVSNIKYSYPISSSREYLSLIIFHNGLVNVKEYSIINGDTKNIIVPQDSKFIISVFKNTTNLYDWNINYNNNDKSMSFDSDFITHIHKNNFSHKEGINYDRKNFLFETKFYGNESILLINSNPYNNSNDNLKFNLNIQIR